MAIQSDGWTGAIKPLGIQQGRIHDVRVGRSSNAKTAHKRQKKLMETDRQTDRLTDRPTDIAGHRVA